MTRKRANGHDPITAAPCSIATEENVLGTLLIEPLAWPCITDVITSADFARLDHQLIFAAIEKLAREDKPHDAILVAEALRASGHLEAAGGLGYLSKLARDTATTETIGHHAQVLRQYSERRRIVIAAARLIERARIITDEPTAEIVQEAQRELASVATIRTEERSHRTPLNWQTLAESTPTERDWAVYLWLAMGAVTLLSGLGGIGKTLLAQIMGTCMALGRDYIDHIARPRRVLVWAGEDEVAEIWRRQIPICEWLGVPLEALQGKLIIESYVGRDITLASLAYGQLVATPMLEELRQQVGDYGAEYVFLDSVARTYGGDENNRNQVTRFVSDYLVRACEPMGAGLCLLGHPGKATGNEYSGSTAWEGSVRSRLYLATHLPDREPDESDVADETVRFLSRRKANYGPKDWRRLNYVNGVLVPETTERPPSFSRPSGQFAQDVVLRAVRRLKDVNLHGCLSTRSDRYLPKLAKQYGFLQDLSEREFTGAMRELVKAKRLETVTVGKSPANRNPVPGLVEVQSLEPEAH